jgi:hypothetical protein
MARRARRRGAIVALVALAALLVSGCDWLQAGYGGGNTFANPYEPNLTASTVGSLHEAYSIDLPDSIVGAPIVVRGSVIVTSMEGTAATVTAYAAATGDVKWATALPGEARFITPPASDGSSVYVGVDPPDLTSDAYDVAALAVDDGTVRWSKTDTAAQGVLRVFVVDGKVVVGGGGVAGYEADTGELLWQNANARGASDGFVTDRYVITQWRSVWSIPHPPWSTVEVRGSYAIDTRDGSEVWAYPEAPESPDWFIGAGSQLIGISAYGGVFAGPVPFPDGPVSGLDGGYPVASASDLLLLRGSGWTAYDLRTGALRYTIEPPSGITSAGRPTIAGTLIYVVTNDATGGTLRTYARSTGAEVSSLALPYSTPSDVIVANGTVYLTEGNTLHAYTTA